MSNLQPVFQAQIVCRVPSLSHSLRSSSMAESSERSGRRCHHTLVIPFPAQGHMIPLLDLSGQLSASGMAVTILVTEKVLPLLGTFLAGSPLVETLVLPLPPSSTLPAGVEHVRDIVPPHSGAHLTQSLAGLAPAILQWARSCATPPGSIIHDFFNGWADGLAADLGVPRVAFYSSGPFVISVFDYLWKIMPQPGTAEVAMIGLPGSPAFLYPHLPSVYRKYIGSGGAPEWELVKRGMEGNPAAWAAVFNTFDALESPYLAHLREEYGHPRVWAVGPIQGAAEGRGGRSSVAAGDVRAWLDVRPARSVVYVCFGSQFRQRAAPARALAAALDRSGVGFIWCVPDGRAEEEEVSLLPEGFEGRVAGRGLVLRGWAPQVEILGHGSVGAFVTHCGWNSVLEGIAAGVGLVAWPMEADQFVNARMLLDLGVAVMACEGGPDTVPDPDELGRILRESVAAEEGRRKESTAGAAAEELGDKAKEAMRGPGGTSFRDFQSLVSALNELSEPNDQSSLIK